MLTAFIAALSEFISGLLCGVLRPIMSIMPLSAAGSASSGPYSGAAGAGEGAGSGAPSVFMEELTPRQLAAKELKARFLAALQRNDGRAVLEILYHSDLDIDTVLEVEDRSMVLASYKQGGTGFEEYI